MSLLINRLARIGRKAFTPDVIDASGIADPREKRSDKGKGGDDPSETRSRSAEEIVKTIPEVRRGIKKRATFAADGIGAVTTAVQLEGFIESTMRLLYSERVAFPMRCGYDKYVRGWSKWRLVVDEKTWRLIDIVPIPNAQPKKKGDATIWTWNGQELHPMEVVVARMIDDPQAKRYEGLLEGADEVAVEEKAQRAVLNSALIKRNESDSIVLVRKDSRSKGTIDPFKGPLEPDPDDGGDDEDALDSGIRQSKFTIRGMLQQVGARGLNPKPMVKHWSATGSQDPPQVVHMPARQIEGEIKAARSSLRRLVSLTEVPLAILGMEEEVNAKGTLLVELLDFMYVVAVDRRKMGRLILQILVRSAIIAGYEIEPGDIAITFSKLGTFTSMIGREVEQQLATAYKYLMETGTLDPVWALQRIYDIPYEEAQQAVIGKPGKTAASIAQDAFMSVVRQVVGEMERPIELEEADVNEAMALYEMMVG